MRKLGIGIIGCGTILSVHLDAVRVLPMADLRCVCDIIEDKARNVAEDEGCRYVTDYKLLLSDDSIDVIHILTPHFLHVPMAVTCLKAGKHVVLEKPVGISFEQLTQLQSVADRCDVTIGVTLQNRFNDSSLMIRDYIGSGELGSFKSARGTVIWHRNDAYYKESDWRGSLETEGGGLLINQAIHTLDLLDWFGGGAKSLIGVIANHTHPTIEVEDTAMATLYYDDGSSSVFYATNSYGDNASVEIELIFEKGKLRFLDQALYLTTSQETVKVADDVVKKGEKAYWGMSHQRCIEDIYMAVILEREPAVTLADAIRATKLVLSVYRSSELNSSVTL